jgi:hypothetical protein
VFPALEVDLVNFNLIAPAHRIVGSNVCLSFTTKVLLFPCASTNTTTADPFFTITSPSALMSYSVPRIPVLVRSFNFVAGSSGSFVYSA